MAAGAAEGSTAVAGTGETDGVVEGSGRLLVLYAGNRDGPGTGAAEVNEKGVLDGPEVAGAVKIDVGAVEAS